MVKPIRSLELLGYVSLMLVAIVLLFPQGEVQVGNWGGIKIFAFHDLLPSEPSAQQKDISSVIALGEADTAFAVQAPPATTLAVTDSAGLANANPIADSAADDKLKNLDEKYRIQFPGNNPATLYGFFAALDSISTKHELLRVLHVGDSQIEGDRVTSFLRHRFQQQFGGCGVGLVPVYEPVNTRRTIVVQSDQKWVKYAAFGNGPKPAHNKFSVLKSYFRFYPFKKVVDSSNTDSVAKVKFVRANNLNGGWTNAWVKYNLSAKPYPLNARFETLKILYRNASAPFQLSIKTDNDVPVKEKMPITDSLGIFKFDVNKDQVGRVELKFGASSSPDIYGVTFDCKEGVAFDNVPLRGSSGTEFTKMNFSLLRQQLRQLNIKFIILQFGVNVVPTELSNYKFYEEMFYKQLKRIKEAAPQVTVLVVGVSDMSKKVSTDYVSYNNIPKIRDAQRNAAFRAGCAFWDLYEAMGGHNSMPSWVNATPPLAGKDYTHFSPRGAQIVAEMLYKSLMLEYNNYRSQIMATNK